MHNESRGAVVRLSRTTRVPAVLVVPGRSELLFVDEVAHDYGYHTKRIRVIISLRSFVAVFLIPLLLFQPFMRVSAQESEALPITENTEPQTIPPTLNESSDGDNTQTPKEALPSTPEEVGAVDPEVSIENTGVTPSDTTETSIPDESVEGPPSSGEGDVASSTDESDQPPSLESGTSSNSTGEYVENTSTTTSEDIQESAPPPDNEEVSIESDEQSPEVTFPESTDEIAAKEISLDALFREREEELRRELRAEIKAEYDRGCIQLESQGFYCLNERAPTFSGSLAPSRSVAQVYSEQDPGGTDKEIYVDFAGERIRLTTNNYDDVFPTKDLSGTSVVWQGMKDGRWQIFGADLSSSTPWIFQLTQSEGGSFNPRVDGKTIVWQAWVDNNWEIFLARPRPGVASTSTETISEEARLVGVGPEWEVIRITRDPEHDMFPSLSGNVVTWQKAQRGGWSVYAYSLESGASTQISSGEGKAENPRFAVVYDVRGESGVKLMSYDVASGEQIDLTARARALPAESSPFTPEAPIEGNDQAALPVSATSTQRVGQDDEPSPEPESSL